MSIDTDLPLFDGTAFTTSSPRFSALLGAIREGVLDREEHDRPPFDAFQLVRHSRVGAIRLPLGEGGGVDIPTLLRTVADLATADSNVAHSLRNHYQFVESLLRRDAAEDEQWRLRVAQGELFGSAIAEPDRSVVGRREQIYATRIVDTGGEQRLYGEKIYSTGNLYADWLVVTAQTSAGSPVRVIVPARADGVVHVDDWDGIGQRFTGSGTTRFDGVLVPVESVFEATVGNGSPAYTATFPQLYLTAVVAGILRDVTEDAARVVRGRNRSFYHSSADQPTDDPLVQLTVGQLSSHAYAAGALVESAARTLDRAVHAHGTADEHTLTSAAALDAARAKVVVDELALASASQLFDTGGGSAVRRSAQLDRHWRNIRTLVSHNPRTLKARAIGDLEISGRPLPNGAFF